MGLWSFLGLAIICLIGFAIWNWAESKIVKFTGGFKK